MKYVITPLLIFVFACSLEGQQPPAVGKIATVFEPPKFLPTEIKVTAKTPSTIRFNHPLRYDYREQVHGNAALGYHRAITIRRQSIGDAKQDGEEINKLHELCQKPLQEIPALSLRNYLEKLAPVFRELEAAAKKSTCDWELENRIDEEGIAVLFPEIQSMRELAAILKFRCHLHLIEGKTLEALHDIRIGFTMAVHVGNGPSLIQSLVGIAIFMIFSNELDLLLQQPDAPNLYWSLTALPPRMIDMRRGMEGEIRSSEGTLTMWRDVEKGIMSPEQARKALDSFTGQQLLLEVNPPVQEINSARLILASLVALQHPHARKSLIAMGRPEAEVNAMPPAQAVILEGKLRFKSLEEEMLVWFSYPYPEADKGLANTEKRLREMIEEGGQLDVFGARLIQLLIPAVLKVHNASGRIDRRLAAFRIIEGIRYYAANHDGELPKSLDEIKEVPIPNDPLTAKPFEYVLEGKTAKLSAMPVDGVYPHVGNALRYAITIQK